MTSDNDSDHRQIILRAASKIEGERGGGVKNVRSWQLDLSRDLFFSKINTEKLIYISFIYRYTHYNIKKGMMIQYCSKSFFNQVAADTSHL